MFERFTDRARSVVVLAQEEARRLNHNYIGTEHLLLGLTREQEGYAAQALSQLGIKLVDVRARVEDIVGRGGSATTGHVPFTPRAKKALELSLREALQLKHDYIGAEHILLGLIREGEGVGARVLDQLGADRSLVRQRVFALLAGGAAPATGAQPASPRPAETPAAARAMERARLLAGGAPLATDDLLWAIVTDTDSLGARALAAFGVTDEALATRLAELDRSGTSDELPEEAGARQTGVEIIGERIAVTLEDDALRQRLAGALKGNPLRSGEVAARAFPSLWHDLHRHLVSIADRLERAAADPWRPPELAGGWEVAAYAVTQRPGGPASFFETAEGVDAEEVRTGIAAWLTAHQPRNQPGVSYVAVLVGTEAGGGRSYRLAWGAVGDAPRTDLQFLVAYGLTDLSAA